MKTIELTRSNPWSKIYMVNRKGDGLSTTTRKTVYHNLQSCRFIYPLIRLETITL